MDGTRVLSVKVSNFTSAGRGEAHIRGITKNDDNVNELFIVVAWLGSMSVGYGV